MIPFIITFKFNIIVGIPIIYTIIWIAFAASEVSEFSSMYLYIYYIFFIVRLEYLGANIYFNETITEIS